MFKQQELNLAKFAYGKKGSLSTSSDCFKKKLRKVVFLFIFLRFLKSNEIMKLKKQFIHGYLK